MQGAKQSLSSAAQPRQRTGQEGYGGGPFTVDAGGGGGLAPSVPASSANVNGTGAPGAPTVSINAADYAQILALAQMQYQQQQQHFSQQHLAQQQQQMSQFLANLSAANASINGVFANPSLYNPTWSMPSMTPATMASIPIPGPSAFNWQSATHPGSSAPDTVVSSRSQAQTPVLPTTLTPQQLLAAANANSVVSSAMPASIAAYGAPQSVQVPSQTGVVTPLNATAADRSVSKSVSSRSTTAHAVTPSTSSTQPSTQTSRPTLLPSKPAAVPAAAKRNAPQPLDFESLSRDLERFQKAAAQKAKTSEGLIETVLSPTIAAPPKDSMPFADDVFGDDDPLVTKMWKFYSKAKSTLPQGERMENLSWRLGGMKLNAATRNTASLLGNDEDRESERRGRKARTAVSTAGNTPESSAGDASSQGQAAAEMDWRQASRSRSRPAHVADMEWRAQSTSRSRSRARVPLGIGMQGTALQPVESRDTASAEMAITSAALASALQQYGGASVGHFGQPQHARLDGTMPTQHVSSPQKQDQINLRGAPIRRRGSFGSSHAPQEKPLAAHSYVGPIRESEVQQNQHSEYGFLPKIVRKTSFDAAYAVTQVTSKPATRSPVRSSQASSISSGHTTRPSVHFAIDNTSEPASQSIDLAALARPAPSQLSSSLSSSRPSSYATTPVGHAPAPINTQIAGSLQGYGTQPPTPSSSGMPYSSAFNTAFTSLPNSPLLNSGATNCFNFALANSTAPSAATSAASSFIDPSVLSQAPLIDPSVLNQTALGNSLFQSANFYNPIDDFSWLNDSAAASPAGPSPVTTDVSTPPSDQLDRIAQGLVFDGIVDPSNLSTNVAFSGGPSRSAPRKRSHHNRAASISADHNGFPNAAQATSGTEGTPVVCSNCSTTNTPLWRRDDSGKPLCNGCGLFKKLHNVDRPLSLATGIVKKRNRSRLKDKKPGVKSNSSRKTAKGSDD